MIAQAYKYSPAKSELKPVGDARRIHSIGLGKYNHSLIFINHVGDKNTQPGTVTRTRTPSGLYHEFQYRGIRYGFTLPDKVKRGQLIHIDVHGEADNIS